MRRSCAYFHKWVARVIFGDRLTFFFQLQCVIIFFYLDSNAQIVLPKKVFCFILSEGFNQSVFITFQISQKKMCQQMKYLCIVFIGRISSHCHAPRDRNRKVEHREQCAWVPAVATERLTSSSRIWTRPHFLCVPKQIAYLWPLTIPLPLPMEYWPINDTQTQCTMKNHFSIWKIQSKHSWSVDRSGADLNR